jgi:hypothetical protein
MIAQKPRQIFRPNPVLGWSLTPDAQVKVPFRNDITQTIGPDGWRYVPHNGGPVELNLAVYGCSYTYGTGLADDETYTALLQASLANVRVLNRGVGGHGSLQNYLQFRQDLKNESVQAAVFGVISDHRFRNVAHPQRMQQYLKADWYERGIEHVPTARQDRSGKLILDYVSIWQPSLLDKGFGVFLPNEFMLDQATFSIFNAIAEMAELHNVPVVFALLDQLDSEFNEGMLQNFPNALDVSTPWDEEHTFFPKDIHPNAYSNRLFSERLLPSVIGLCEYSGCKV